MHEGQSWLAVKFLKKIVKNLAHQVVCFSLLVKQWAAVTAMLGVSKVPEKKMNFKALNLIIYLNCKALNLIIYLN